MKQWTKHDARTAQTTEPDQFNAQHQSFRSQMVGLDRAQLPEACVTKSRLTTDALHKCWVFSPWDTGVTNAQGEQTVKRATASETLAEQFRALTYGNHTSGWLTAFETTLTPFKGGNLLVEWYGCSAIQTMFGWSFNAKYDSTSGTGKLNDKYVGLRILVNGVTMVERIGPAKALDHFSISGSSQLPSGPVTLTCQWNPTAAGPDDQVVDYVTTTKVLMQAHLFANRVFAIGRFR